MTDARTSGLPNIKGTETGRWSGKRTHTVHPIQCMVVIGGLTVGFEFYGPFPTHEKAGAWATENLKAGVHYHIHNIHTVRAEG